jgi:hypothetical protein
VADQLQNDATEPAISAQEEVGQAVVRARAAGVSWATVGLAVGGTVRTSLPSGPGR